MQDKSTLAASVRAALLDRSIVMVGMMGCGKSAIGRRLANALDLRFIDADDEIEKAAGMSINDIFAQLGEQHFRDGERRVISRLLAGGPQVLSTGGGAFMSEETRRNVEAHGVSVWLRAELALLMRRVSRRDNRPLLRTPNPEARMRELLAARTPTYAEATVTVESRDVQHDVIVAEIIDKLAGVLVAPAAKTPTLPSTAVPEIRMPNDQFKPAVPAPAPPVRRQVEVELGSRSYGVTIGPGLIAEAGRLIADKLGPSRCTIVTDANVERAGHLAALEASLGEHHKVLGRIVMASGEKTKGFAGLETVVDCLLGSGTERKDLVVALGGGVIGDLAGFAAAVLRRGVRFVQIPTTLLSHVDSSVGGKTGINTRHGKNLAGAFHQPSLVLADTSALTTLPDRQLRAGYAEIAKHAALGDAAYFEWLEANVGRVMARDTAALVHAIARSVEMKAAIVARDETEQGDRMLLNLGHTFGHALEAWAGYSDRLLHGEAVSIGTAIACRFSESLGMCTPGTASRLAAHLNAAGLPVGIGQIAGSDRPTVSELFTLMTQDKKVSGGRMTFILMRAIGEAFIARDIDESAVKRCLEAEIAAGAG